MMVKLGATIAIEQNNKAMVAYHTVLASDNLSRAKFFILLMLILDYKFFILAKVANAKIRLYTRDNEMYMCGYVHTYD